MGRNYSYEKPEYKEKLKQIMQKQNRKGANNPNWKGGIANQNGFLLRKEAWDILGYLVKKYHGKTIGIHRLIMEKLIGRPLLSTEIVHHINEIRYDNKIENLKLLSNLGEHNIIHKSKGVIL